MLVAVIFLGGCAGDRVATRGTTARDFDLHDGYIWSTSTPTVTEGHGKPVPDGELRERVRAGLEAELRAAGLAPITSREAPLAVSAVLLLGERVTAQDPYYSNHVAARREVGTLVVEFRAGEGGRLIWRGASQAELRVVARGSGITSLDWTETGEQAHWPLERMIEEVVIRSGLRDSGLEGDRGRRPLSRESRRSLFRQLDESFPEPQVEIERRPEP